MTITIKTTTTQMYGSNPSPSPLASSSIWSLGVVDVRDTVGNTMSPLFAVDTGRIGRSVKTGALVGSDTGFVVRCGRVRIVRCVPLGPLAVLTLSPIVLTDTSVVGTVALVVIDSGTAVSPGKKRPGTMPSSTAAKNMSLLGCGLSTRVASALRPARIGTLAAMRL